MNLPIILIGPMSAGKSTIGSLLAEKLACPNYSLDDKRWDYYDEIGYDHATADEIRRDWNQFFNRQITVGAQSFNLFQITRSRIE